MRCCQRRPIQPATALRFDVDARAPRVVIDVLQKPGSKPAIEAVEALATSVDAAHPVDRYLFDQELVIFIKEIVEEIKVCDIVLDGWALESCWRHENSPSAKQTRAGRIS